MFEQRIYGRAKEQFVRSDGRTIRLGYGYLVESAGFSNVGSAVNDMVGEFPTQLVDGFGMLPIILVKKAFATDKGEAQLIQQTVQIESDRPYALTHQMIADPDSVTSLVQRPDLWMNVYFAAEEYDWGTISLPSTNSIPAGNNVPTAPLSNVLSYFGMGTQTFVTLLCSLFDTIRSSKVYTVVVFPDNMQDYDYWNRCLIVYIYYFMPYSMRRRLGFETWMTGTVNPENCELYFAAAKNIRNTNGHFSVILNKRSRPNDLSDAFLFWGDGYRHRKSQVLQDETCDTESAYRKFITPWVEVSVNEGASGAARINQLNYDYWEMFDKTPDGKSVLEPNKGFEFLQEYQQIKEGQFAISSLDNLVPFTGAFYSSLGEQGAEALSYVIERDYNSNVVIDHAKKTNQSEELIIQNTVRELLKMLAPEKYGQAISKTVSSLVPSLLEQCPMEKSFFRPLMVLEEKGILHLSDQSWCSMINQFNKENCNSEDWIALAQGCAGKLEDGNRVILSPFVQNAAMQCFLEAIPQRMIFDDVTKRLASIIRDSANGGSVASSIIRRFDYSFSEIAVICAELIVAFPQIEAKEALIDRLNTVSLPDNILSLVDSVIKLKIALQCEQADIVLRDVLDRHVPKIHYTIDEAVDTVCSLAAAFGQQFISETVISIVSKASSQTLNAARLLIQVNDSIPTLYPFVMEILLKNENRSLSETLSILIQQPELDVACQEIVVEVLKKQSSAINDSLVLLNSIEHFKHQDLVAFALVDLFEASFGNNKISSAQLHRYISIIGGFSESFKGRLLYCVTTNLDCDKTTLSNLLVYENIQLDNRSSEALQEIIEGALDDKQPLSFETIKCAEKLSSIIQKSGFQEQSNKVLAKIVDNICLDLPEDVDANALQYCSVLYHWHDRVSVSIPICAILERYCDNAQLLHDAIVYLRMQGVDDELICDVLKTVRIENKEMGSFIHLFVNDESLLAGVAGEVEAILIRQLNDSVLSIEELYDLLRSRASGIIHLDTDTLNVAISTVKFDDSAKKVLNQLTSSFDISEADCDTDLMMILHQRIESASLKEISKLTQCVRIVDSDCLESILRLLREYIYERTIASSDIRSWYSEVIEIPNTRRDELLHIMVENWIPKTEDDVIWGVTKFISSEDQYIQTTAEHSIFEWCKDSCTCIHSTDLVGVLLNAPIDNKQGLLQDVLQHMQRIASVTVDFQRLLLRKELSQLDKGFISQIQSWCIEVIDELDLPSILSCLTASARYTNGSESFDESFERAINESLLHHAEIDNWDDRQAPYQFRILKNAYVDVFRMREYSKKKMEQGDIDDIEVIKLIAGRFQNEKDKSVIYGWLLPRIENIGGDPVALISRLLELPISDGRQKLIHDQLLKPIGLYSRIDEPQLINWIEKTKLSDPGIIPWILARIPELLEGRFIRRSDRLIRALLSLTSHHMVAIQEATIECLGRVLSRSLLNSDPIKLSNRIWEDGISQQTSIRIVGRAISYSNKPEVLTQTVYQRLSQNTEDKRELLLLSTMWAYALDESIDAPYVCTGYYNILKNYCTRPENLYNALKLLSDEEYSVQYSVVTEKAMSMWVKDSIQLAKCSSRIRSDLKEGQHPWHVKDMNSMSTTYIKWLSGYILALTEVAFTVTDNEFAELFGNSKVSPASIFSAWPDIIQRSLFSGIAAEGFGALCSTYIKYSQECLKVKEYKRLYIPDAYPLERPKYVKCMYQNNKDTFFHVEIVCLMAFLQNQRKQDMVRFPDLLQEFAGLFPDMLKKEAKDRVMEAASFVCTITYYSVDRNKFNDTMLWALILWCRPKEPFRRLCEDLLNPQKGPGALQITIRLLSKWKDMYPTREGCIRKDIEATLPTIKINRGLLEKTRADIWLKSLERSWNKAVHDELI